MDNTSINQRNKRRCCVSSCQKTTKDNVSLFRLPYPGSVLPNKVLVRRVKWINILKHSSYADFTSCFVYVCGNHFLNGKPANLTDSSNPDWVPHLNLDITNADLIFPVPLPDDPEPSSSLSPTSEEECLLEIKQESPEEVFVNPISLQKLTKPNPLEASFCSLCLRQCTEELVQQFSPYQSWNGVSREDRREKLEQVLPEGLQGIGQDCAICRTCWGMVELVVDFRQSCLKMDELRGRFPFGVGKKDDGGVEEWFTVDALDGLRRTRKMVQDHVEQVEMNAVDLRNELDSKVEDAGNDTALLDEDTNFAEEHIEEDLEKSSEEPTEMVEDSNDEPNLTLEESILMPLFPCSNCNRSFDSKTSLLLHQNYCNGPKPDRKYSCTICSADFISRASFVGHMNKHKGIKPFQCSNPGCTISFYSTLTRRVHEQGCGSTRFVCAVCGVSCKNASRYRVHKASHEEPTLSCPHCDKKFTDGLYLKRHQKVHTNARNYPCDVCGKAFKTNYAARVHMRIHTQEKPFVCTVCGMGFAYKCLVKPHMEKNHDG